MYSPHNQLPAPEPKTKQYPVDHFYNNTAKHLIKDAIKIMDNGLNVDLDKVAVLESILVDQLTDIEKELSGNKLIDKYLKQRYKKEIAAYKEDRKSKMRTAESYLVPFKYNDMIHRSYFMEEYAKTQGWGSPKEKLPTGVSKWPIKSVRPYAKVNHVIEMLLKGTLPANMSAIKIALQRLTEDKAALYNQKYVAQCKKPSLPYPKFNPGSAQQKQELFKMLDIESEDTSKITGLPKWDRTQVETVNKITDDKDVKHFTQQFIDHSFAAIIKNNFIEAFYTFNVNSRLYGQYKLLGAKTGRFTSSQPNLLNMPSTGSRFAKAVKECFTAPKGKIILAADYNALEDRVIASISRDKNKITLQTDEELDGHLFHATIYFRKKFVAKLGEMPHRELTIAANAAMEAGDKDIIALRQKSKGVTFGASYGAYPPKISKQIKCTLAEAEDIFNAYHNDMYPSITDYRENYILPTAIKNGQLHLGLGFTLKSDDPKKDIRTLANATIQFWSILTALTINRMHQLIDEAGLQDDILTISTIYDSIYYEVTDDNDIIEWLNKTLIETMLVDFMPQQTVPNDANADLGYNWATMISLSKTADKKEIQTVKDKLKE